MKGEGKEERKKEGKSLSWEMFPIIHMQREVYASKSTPLPIW